MALQKEYYRGWFIEVWWTGYGLARPWVARLFWARPELVPESHGLEVTHRYELGSESAVNSYQEALAWAMTQIDNPDFNQGLVSTKPDPRLGVIAPRPATTAPELKARTTKPEEIPTLNEGHEMAEPKSPSWIYTFLIANWKTTVTALVAGILWLLTRATGVDDIGNMSIQEALTALFIWGVGLFSRDANVISEKSVGKVEVIHQKQDVGIRAGTIPPTA